MARHSPPFGEVSALAESIYTEKELELVMAESEGKVHKSLLEVLEDLEEIRRDIRKSTDVIRRERISLEQRLQEHKLKHVFHA